MDEQTRKRIRQMQKLAENLQWSLPGYDIQKLLQPTIQAYLSPLMQDVHRQVQLMVDTLQPSLDALMPTLELIQSQTFQHIQEIAAQATEALERYRSAKEAFDPVIVQLGWPPPREIPLHATTEIVRMFDEHGKEATQEAVDQFLVGYYDSDVIEAIRRDWLGTTWLASRHDILESLLDGYLGSHYNLVIPTAFAQAEGIVAESFAHRGRLFGSEFEEYLEDLLTSDDWLYDQEAVRDFAFTYTRAQFGFGEAIGSELSRHAIMHGGDTDYGTQQNALKLILLLDYIIDSAAYFSTESGRCYHNRECGHLTHSNNGLRVFRSSREAEEDDLAPCSFCLNGERPR